MDRLKRRADFLAAATGERAHATPFLVQARNRGDRGKPRIGLTVTKKSGNAVERNRIRRRLRAAANDVLTRVGRQGYDYVLVARRAALAAPFETMLRDLERTVARLHAGRKSGHRPDRTAGADA
jgi:ribonuclease P protein component